MVLATEKNLNQRWFVKKFFISQDKLWVSVYTAHISGKLPTTQFTSVCKRHFVRFFKLKLQIFTKLVADSPRESFLFGSHEREDYARVAGELRRKAARDLWRFPNRELAWINVDIPLRFSKGPKMEINTTWTQTTPCGEENSWKTYKYYTRYAQNIDFLYRFVAWGGDLTCLTIIIITLFVNL